MSADAETHFFLGLLWDQAGKSDNAAGEYKEVVRIRPASPNVWFNLGLAYTQLKNIEEAKTAFQKAVELKPDYAEAHLALGMIHDAFNDVKQGVHHFNKAHDLFAAEKNTFQAQLAKQQLAALKARQPKP